MIPRSVKSPTIPIPFHKLLKVVAIVDAKDPQTKQLLDHITAENFRVEVTESFERDVSEDAEVGAYRAAGQIVEVVKQLPVLLMTATFPQLARAFTDSKAGLVRVERALAGLLLAGGLLAAAVLIFVSWSACVPGRSTIFRLIFKSSLIIW